MATDTGSITSTSDQIHQANPVMGEIFDALNHVKPLRDAGIIQGEDGNFYDKDNPDQPLMNANGKPMNKDEALEYAKKKKKGDVPPPATPNGSGTPPAASDGNSAPPPASGAPDDTASKN